MKRISAADAMICEKRQYQSARAVFLLAVIFTFTNVFADYFGYTFLFSSSMFTLASRYVARLFAVANFGEYLYKVCLPALLAVIPMGMIWYASRRRSIFFVLAFLFLLTDTVLLIADFCHIGLLNLLFHFLVIGCMLYGMYDVGLFRGMSGKGSA